ncbi:MAG: DUF4249 family protein [Saprospiraceae bacterium]
MRRQSFVIDGVSILLLASWMLVGGYGCLSEIFLEVPPGNSEALAIRGWVKDAEMPEVAARITKVSDFKVSDTPVPVNNATVSLWDGKGNVLDIPFEEDGLYRLLIPGNDRPLQILPGSAYHLVVKLPDGRQYESATETLWPVPEPRNMEYQIIKRIVKNEVGNLEMGEFLQFLINTPLLYTADGRRSFLKWDFQGVYRFTETNLTVPYPNTRTCYFSEALNLEQVSVYDGNANSSDQLLRYLLMEEPLDYRFYDGFYLTTRQQSLSEGAYEYWQSLGEIVNRTGNFFESPPGKLKGNFRNVEQEAEEVFGYFYATQERIIRQYVPPLPERVNAFCPLSAHPDDETVLPLCLDCQSRAGSTLIKPVYWEE